MKKNKLLLLFMILLTSCNQPISSESSSINDSSSSNTSSSEETNTSSSESVSSSSSSSSVNQTIESIELIIKNENIRIGDEINYEVKILPETIKADYIVEVGDNLVINDGKILAIKNGTSTIKVSVDDKFDTKEVNINNYSTNDIKSVFENNISVEKNELTKANVYYYSKDDYGVENYESEISYFEGPSITTIKRNYDIDTNEATSTVYTFLGTYQDNDYSMQKTMPDGDSLDKFDTSIDYYDNKELFYDSETGQTGILNAIDYITFDKSYIGYETVQTINQVYENEQLNVSLSIEKHVESTSYFNPEHYLMASLNFTIQNNKIINFNFSQTKYFNGDFDKKEFDEESANKKTISYSLVWNNRQSEDLLNVVPTNFLPVSFDVKLFKDEEKNEETYAFKVGDNIYYSIENINPVNAFSNVNVTYNSKGGEITNYSTITCSKAGEVELIFTALNGVNKKVNITIEDVLPESVEFDSWMDSTVKVNSTITIFVTVYPSASDDSVEFSIVEGEEFISIDTTGYFPTIKGIKPGKAIIKVTCLANTNVFATKEITVEA